MTDLKLSVTTTRKASVQEIDDLVFGSGATGYEWWKSVSRVDGGFRIIAESIVDEGRREAKTLTYEDILHAAGIRLTGNPYHGDAMEAIFESIGYLDADEADCVLQIAFFGQIVFG